jgi:hypothetical protein
MNNKALWFMWFVILALLLFASIFVSRLFKLNPYVVDAIIGVIITSGALLHFHFSGNLKKYPVQSYRLMWQDSRYGDTALYAEGIKSNMNFFPWDQITRLYVTTVDFRQGMTVIIVDRDERVKAIQVLDMEGFKAAVASASQFRIEDVTVPTGC